MTGRRKRLAAGLLAALSAGLVAWGAEAGGEGGPDSYRVLILRDAPARQGLDLSIDFGSLFEDEAAGNDLSGADLVDKPTPREAERERRIPEDWQLRPPEQGRFRGYRTR